MARQKIKRVGYLRKQGDSVTAHKHKTLHLHKLPVRSLSLAAVVPRKEQFGSRGGRHVSMWAFCFWFSPGSCPRPMADQGAACSSQALPTPSYLPFTCWPLSLAGTPMQLRHLPPLLSVLLTLHFHSLWPPEECWGPLETF